MTSDDGEALEGDIIDRSGPSPAGTVRDLERELEWMAAVVDFRVEQYFSEVPAVGVEAGDGWPAPPDSATSSSAWATFVRENDLSRAERAAVVLALIPHLRPRLLDVFLTRNAMYERRFTEFGGVTTDDGFEPTGETLSFLLGGQDLATRFTVARILEPEHRLVRAGVLRLDPGPTRSPIKGPLRVDPNWLRHITVGRTRRPALGADFPAHRLQTHLGWDDLVLHPGTLQQVNEILAFVTHGRALMVDWGMAPRLRPGHRALFYGPPGTGKTLTAALLGQQEPRRDVYRVDLSLVVSKYIGETEKNLARVFDGAQQHGWILFFDEADALFGKTLGDHERP